MLDDLAVGACVNQQDADAAGGHEVAGTSASQKVEPPPTKHHFYKFIERAFQQYAIAHNVEVTDVTHKILNESKEGVEGWAFRGIDTGSQGALRQSLRAFLKKPENAKHQETYKYLSAELQLKFALAWGQEKTFEFLEESKRNELWTRTQAGKKRQFMTPKQIAAHLGDAKDPDCISQAEQWTQACWDHVDPDGKPWYKWHSVLGIYLFLYEWEIEEEMDGETTTAMTNLTNSKNMFEEAATQRKAVLNFAAKHDMTEYQVSVAMVKESDLGIDGWAAAGEPESLGGRKRKGANPESLGGSKKVTTTKKPSAPTSKKASTAQSSGSRLGGIKISDVDREMKKVLPLLDQKVALRSVVEKYVARLENDSKFKSWAKDLVMELEDTMDKTIVSNEHIGWQIQEIRASFGTKGGLGKAIHAQYKEESLTVLATFARSVEALLDAAKPIADQIVRMLGASKPTNSAQSPRS
jgi:hypothetical protein